MEALEPARDWIIADTLLKHPADAKLLPCGFQYIFEDERLTIYAHGIGINRRWEFQLNIDEVMPDEATIKSWIEKYISLDKITVTRISKYAHNSLVAKQWHNNRIFLAGDAAHMMPPSAGQGLCSGVRDAVNLAWKLEAVIKKQFDASLLYTYEQERKPHLFKILHRTLFFGKTLQADTAFSRFLRNIQLRTIQSFSPLKNYLRIKYNTPPVFKEGFLSNTSALAGHHVPQVKLAGGEFSDAIIGYRFVCIGLPGSFTAAQLHFLKERNIGLLHEQTDIMQTTFPAWLAEHDIDFALVRPDKIICTAGKMDAFDLLLHPFNLYSDLRS
jgi:3-(3-hydroxy-phenyl)propionate hydroxylase